MILLMTMLIFASAAQSQILKRLKNRVQQKVEDKVEQKVNQELDQAAEQMVENSWNSIFGEGGFSSGDSSRGFSLPFNSNVTTEDSYRFDMITTMEVQSTNQDGERQPPMMMYMHFNEDAAYTGTRFSSEEMDQNGGEMFMIYDFNNEAMIMLMDSEDGKYSFAYDWNAGATMMGGAMADEDVEEEEDEEWPGFERIGTRTIAGSSCEGYRSQSEYSETEIWVTQDYDAGFQRMFQANSGMKHLKGKVPEDYPSGMMMEMTYKDLDSGETTVMRVTDIDTNANVTKSMSDYPTLSLGDMANQQ